MGTLLRVLTVFIFLLSILAFVMGYANFEQRELLIGRTHMLQEYVTKIAKTIEVGQPELPEDDPNSPYEFEPVEWDLDAVTAREVETPETSDFWDSYSNALEVAGSSFVHLDTEAMEEELRHYYLTRMEDGKEVVVKDSQGRPRTRGAGTMHDRLEDVLARAVAQLGRLNETRKQLIEVREKLNEVAGLLNEEKRERRRNLRTIEELKAEIARLEDVIVTKDNEIAKLQREKLELADEVQNLNAQIVEKDQTIQEKDAEIERLRERVKYLESLSGENPSAPAAAGAAAANGMLTPGVKGKVVDVNRELSFVVIELTPQAAAEIVPNGTFQPVDMDIHRPGLDTIVTRVRITNPPSAARITIGDNVYGWEQTPVKVGDEVVF